MRFLLSLIAELRPVEAEQTASAMPEINWLMTAFCTLGLCIFIVWLFWFGGFGALKEAPIRRNRMFGFLPVILLSLWVLLMRGIYDGIAFSFTKSSESFQEGLGYSLMAVMDISLIIVMLIIAHKTFARRLKGFGLNTKTAGRDAAFGLVNLIAVYPFILLALWVTLIIGQLINKEFDLEVHQTLTFLSENGSSFLEVLTVLFAIIIVPIFEEMLFRGLIQTSILSLCGYRWIAILLTSLLFAILHPATHVGALFVFSCALGYAYERSGSLFRPILMHVFFNGFSVAATLFSLS